MIPFHFDGSGKRRREIRLQGSSAQQQWNKETLLQKAQEERRVRQRERDRQEAARRLQRWIRRTILPRHRIMSQLESDWIQAMKTLKHPPTFENLLELQLQGASSYFGFLVFHLGFGFISGSILVLLVRCVVLSTSIFMARRISLWIRLHHFLYRFLYRTFCISFYLLYLQCTSLLNITFKHRLYIHCLNTF